MVRRLVALIFGCLSIASVPVRGADDVDLVFMYSDLEPYVVAADKGVTGFIGDYMNEVAETAGVHVSWRYIPWDTQIPLLKRNQANLCGVALFKTEERETFLKFSPPIGEDDDFVLVGRRADTRLMAHQSLAAVLEDKSLIGIVQNNTSYGDKLDALLEGHRLQAATGSTSRILRDLATGTGDYFVATREAALDFMPRAGLGKLAIYDHFQDMKGAEPYFLTCTLATDTAIFARISAAIREKGPVHKPHLD